MSSGRAENHSPEISDDFYLKEWLVQPGRNRIFGAQGETRVEPMIMRVLLCLVEADGATVRREWLNEQVWEGRIVNEKALTRAISSLRKNFGDPPRQAQFIETVSKTGYRLLVSPDYRRIQNQQNEQRGAPETQPNSSTSPQTLIRVRPLLWAGLLSMVAIVIGIQVLRKSTNKPTPFFPNHPAVPVTTYPGHELRPRLSPSGDQVLFAWQGPNADNWDIYLKHVNNGEPHRLTDHPDDDLSPVWSPDGSKVAYFRFGPQSCGLFIQSIPSGEAKKVRDCFRIPVEEIAFVAPKLSWSPDGSELAFTAASGPEDLLRIVIFSLETGEVSQLGTPPKGFIGDLSPAFSPDGRNIAVCRLRTWSDRELVVINRKTGKEQQLTFDHRIILGHDWTPDGKHLVYASNRKGNYALWTVALKDGSSRWLPAKGGYLKYPSLARNGNALVYENWQYDSNLWCYPLSEHTEEDPKACISSTQWDFQPDYDEVHQRFAFISNRAGNHDVWSSDQNGGNPIQLTDVGSGVAGAPRWSPDGESLVFHLWREGKADIMRWQRDQGPATVVAQTKADELFPHWSADGSQLFFTSNHSGDWQIWRKALESGTSEQLTRSGGYFALPTHDGKALIFNKGQDPDIWKLDLVNPGKEKRLFSLDSAGDWGNLAVVDRGIFFIQRDKNYRPSLALYRFSDGSTETLRPLTENLPIHEPGMAAPVDGRWILLTQIDQTEDDLYFTKSYSNVSN